MGNTESHAELEPGSLWAYLLGLLFEAQLLRVLLAGTRLQAREHSQCMVQSSLEGRVHLTGHLHPNQVDSHLNPLYLNNDKV